MTEEELQDMIDQADRDGDGEINPDEFYRIMKKRGDNPLGARSSSLGAPSCHFRSEPVTAARCLLTLSCRAVRRRSPRRRRRLASAPYPTLFTEISQVGKPSVMATSLTVFSLTKPARL